MRYLYDIKFYGNDDGHNVTRTGSSKDDFFGSIPSPQYNISIPNMGDYW